MARKNTDSEETNQLLLRPPVRLIEKLREMAQRYGFASGPQAAIDIIQEYLDDWIELQERIRGVREEQRALRGKARASLPHKERRKAS